jgi:hypothetical protein
LTYVFSVYVKAGTHSFIQLARLASPVVFANFDLAAGTVGTSNVTANIQNVGSGWYRCSITVTATATVAAAFYISMVESASTSQFGNWNPVGTETIELWGAQLEQRSTVTAYTPTTTAPITNYIPVLQTAAANVARFDHNPVTGESLGLLIEESRSNLLTYSADYSNAAWTKTNVAATVNTVVAPDGTLTGNKIASNNTAGGGFLLGQNVSVTSGTAYTFTTYLKAAELGFAFVGFAGTGFGSGFLSVNLATGASFVALGTLTSSSVTPAGNGWWRVSTTITAAATALGTATAYLSNDGIWANRVNNVTATTGWYMWGAQLEAGEFSSSYIPTVAAQVTRSADSATMLGANFSSWYNPAEGTLYAEGSSYRLGYSPAAVLWDGNNNLNNRIDLTIPGTAGPARFDVQNGGVSQASFNLTGGYTAGVMHKAAGAYKTNDFNLARDGVLSVADTSGTVPVVDRLRIGGRDGLQNKWGHIRSIRYWNQRLTNAQLQAITT